MSRASHVAAFAAGAAVAVAVAAIAAPRADVERFKTLDTFAQTLATIEASYVDPTDEKQLIYDAARGMLHNLDPHSTFLPPSRYQKMRQDTEGEFGGVGLTLGPGVIDDARPSVPPYTTVDDVVPRSPADVAGVQVDDRIVSIDGEPTAEVGHEMKEASAWEAKLRGPSGTRVTLAILRVGWREPRAFAIVRAQVKQPSVRHKLLEPGIGYIAIARFAEATSSDVTAALGELRRQGALGVLVLDLRGDPGGLVDQAVATADLFLDDGVIVTTRGKHGTTDTQRAHRGGPGVDLPIVALVDNGTASAAEILAAALHDHERAQLVGQPTYGKGTVQTFFDLDDGSGLKLTTARYYTPNGKSLESKGLIPDVPVDAFAPMEIVAGGSGSGSAAAGSGDRIEAAGNVDDPQLATAVQIARRSVHAPTK
jgi:carboxyl-terminal processing protease